MQVKTLDESFENEYNSFLESIKNPIIYYTKKYRKFLELMTNSNSLYKIAVSSNGEIFGLLPLMIKEGKYGKVINSLPYYGSYGGIISKNNLSRKVLIEYYNDLINKEDYLSSVIISNPFNQALKAENYHHNKTDFRIGQITELDNLSSSMDKTIMNFHYKTRNMIRKAIKNNVEVFIDNNDLEFLKITHQENMKKIGGTPKNDKFFEIFPKIFLINKEYNIYYAKVSEKKIASLLLFYSGETVEYFMPAIDLNYRNLQPLSLIICKAMIDSFKIGYKFWNWGGTWPSQEGVYRFKSRWNSKDFKYYYYINSNEDRLRKIDLKELQREYDNFYVYPYDKLKSK